MKKYFVTIDGKESEEVFSPNTNCSACDTHGSYVLKEADLEYFVVGLCLKCMYVLYDKRIRVEEVPK